MVSKQLAKFSETVSKNKFIQTVLADGDCLILGNQ